MLDAGQVFAYPDHPELLDLQLRQIACADMVILNKIDLATPEALRRIYGLIDDHFNNIRIVETSYCDVPYEILLGVGRFDPTRLMTAASPNGKHHHPDTRPAFDTWSFETDHPLSLAASAMLAFGSASAFAQSGPAGDWTLAMATPQGTTNVALSLKVAGDKVTGEMNSPMGPVAVAGTAAGNDINVTADIAIQGMALTFVIGFPLLWLLLSLVGWVGQAWWLWGFAVIFGFQLLMLVLYPKLILPLFNKLTPLPEGELRTGIRCSRSAKT